MFFLVGKERMSMNNSAIQLLTFCAVIALYIGMSILGFLGFLTEYMWAFWGFIVLMVCTIAVGVIVDSPRHIENKQKGESSCMQK